MAKGAGKKAHGGHTGNPKPIQQKPIATAGQGINKAPKHKTPYPKGMG